MSEGGGKVTVVEKGAKFERLDDQRFSADPNREEDLNELCANGRRGRGRQRLRVVYFCDPSSPRPAEAVAAEYRREVDDKINAPIVLIRSLMRHADAKNVSVTFVTPRGAGDHRDRDDRPDDGAADRPYSGGDARIP